MAVILVACCAVPGAALAQCVSLTTLGSAYTQNFDTLSNTAGSTTNNLTITGWFLTETGGGARDNEQYAVDTGASNTGDTYSFGAAASTDRALGGLRSGTLISSIGACFTNNTGTTLASLDIAYVGEEWRLGTVARTDQLTFEYSTNATSLATGAWTAVPALQFTTPDTATVGAKNGNAVSARTARSSSVTGLAIANGATFWIRWNDVDAGGADDGLAVDDVSLTPQGAPALPNLSLNDVTLNEGNAGTTSFTFTVSLSAPAGPGGVTFDIATADGSAVAPGDYTARALTGQTIPAGSSIYSFSVLVNGDTAFEPNETFFVNVTSVTGATAVDAQGTGTIVNDDAMPLTFIHDVQGNGAASPIPGSTVAIEGVVVMDAQGSAQLSGFFLQEEDADNDADPATSEGLFVACGACGTAVAEGQRVRATGVVSEVDGMTQLASTSVVVADAGNNLAQVTPATIDLPIAGAIDMAYEAREGMRVTFVDTLTVADLSQLAGIGDIALYEGGRPWQFTDTAPPSVAGFTAHADNLARRRVLLDDDSDAPFSPLVAADGMQAVFHPRANGGYSIGTQGTDFVRGGDAVNGLTGVLHWSSGGTALAAWRVRPTSAFPATFTVANPRPATTPATGGAIRIANLNLQDYFTTIDTTASGTTGPCGPAGTAECRGADSVAELNRQRARVSIVVCSIDADVVALQQLENTTASATIVDLLGAVNARCGGANPYAFVNTGGTLGTDVVRVAQIYRTGVVSPVGSPLADLDPVHDRPPTAQTFDVVNAANPAFGQRFSAIVADLHDRDCAGAAGADADAGDGQGCFAATRDAQATRLLAWITGTVLPAAGDPDVVLLGDVNAYAQESAVATLIGGGLTALGTTLPAASAYSEIVDGLLGRPDEVFASASLVGQVTGIGYWHIGADEAALFDYSDEIRDTGEAPGEEKPDGSALVPPRVLFQPASAYRMSDRDPVIVGLFLVSDLAVTVTDSPDPITAGSDLAYTITIGNNGPDAASGAAWNDTLPAGTTFVSLPAVAGWSCTTPAVGTGGTVSCSNPSFAVGNAVFTLTVHVAPDVAAGTVLSDTATVSSTSGDDQPGNNSATATTTVAASADLGITVTDSPDPVTPGTNLGYTVTVGNNGPSNAASVSLSDTLPAGTTFVSLSSPGGWSCTTPAVGAGGTVSCSAASVTTGSAAFTLVVQVDPATAPGTVLSNTAMVASATSDPAPADNSATATTTVGAAAADLSIANVDTPDPVSPGTNLGYTVTVGNNGPSDAASVNLSDTLPADTTFVSLSSPGGWSCTTPAVGAGGTVSCSAASLAQGSAAFTLVVQVDPSTAPGTVLSNTATVASTTNDPVAGNESATATTTVGGAVADLSVGNVDTPDPATAGSALNYTITVANAGPGNAQTVALSDALPAGTTFVSLSSPAGWSCTTPAVGANGTVACDAATLPVGSAVFTLGVQVDAAVPDASVLSNTAAVTASSTDASPGDESATATTTVLASADVGLLVADAPDPVAAGGVLTYTLTASNAGPGDAATVNLADTLPAGTTFVSLSAAAGWSCTTPAVGAGGTVACNAATLPVGNAAFTLVVAVDAAVADGTALANTATLTSATTDPNPGNESATATTTVTTSADLGVSVVDTPDPVTPGGVLTYAITLANAGSSDASGVSLSDTLPAGTTFVSLASPAGWACTTPAVGAAGAIGCTRASLPPGSEVFTLVVNIDADVATGTVLANSATAASATTDPNPGNETGTASTTVGSGSADVAATKTAAASVQAGETLAYTIGLENIGPSDATSVTLDDTLPAGTTFVSLAAPADYTCTTPAVGAGGTVACTRATMPLGNAAFTLVVAVAADVADGTVLANTATAASATTDPVPGNGSATASTTVAAAADLGIAIAGAPDPVLPGGTLTYTLTLDNAGPAQATAASLSDIVPAGTTFLSLASPAGWNCTTPAVGGTGTIACALPVFAPGTAAFTLVVQVDAGVAQGSSLVNTATSSSATDDPAPANNNATATTAVGDGSADLSVTKTAAPDPVLAGATLVYTITAANAGPSNATAFALTDTLPADTTFVSLVAPSGYDCTVPAVGAAGTVACSHPSMPIGSAVFTLVVGVDDALAGGTVLSNTATVASATVDPTPANNSATATSTVSAPAAVTATKQASGTLQPGGSVSYAIVLTNNGTATQADNPGDEFVDALPEGLTLLSATATAGTVLATIASDTVTWNGAIAPGASVTITIVAQIDATLPAGSVIVNQGLVHFDADGNGSNEASGVTDDPGTAAAFDGTAIALPGSVATPEARVIPASSDWARWLLVALLAMVAAGAMRRRGI